jgi:hypothetical protein
MSIIKCNECGNDISDKAAACPKCGAPVEKEKVQQEQTKTYEAKPSYTPPQVHEEQKSFFRRFGWIFIVALAILGLIAFLNNPNSIPGVKIQINTPKPQVVTARADDADASVFNYKETVYATISNQGGDGNILVNFHITQAGKTTNKTMPIYMRAGQNLDVKQIFDEVTRLGGKMLYSVDAVAR